MTAPLHAYTPAGYPLPALAQLAAYVAVAAAWALLAWLVASWLRRARGESLEALVARYREPPVPTWRARAWALLEALLREEPGTVAVEVAGRAALCGDCGPAEVGAHGRCRCGGGAWVAMRGGAA